jgi:predicted Zn-dependent protease
MKVDKRTYNRIAKIAYELADAGKVERPVLQFISDYRGMSANPRWGIITIGDTIIRDLKTKHEIAIVLGHEIGHLNQKPCIELSNYDWDFSCKVTIESKADFYGIDIAKKAGYNVNKGVKVAKRILYKNEVNASRLRLLAPFYKLD